MVISLQRFDQKIVGGKPDRPAPIGVAAEEPGVRFARRIFGAMHLAAGAKLVRMCRVKLRHGTNPVRGEKFVFIEDAAQHAFETDARGNRDQPMAMVALAMSDLAGEVLAMFQEPGKPLVEAG